MGMIAEAWGFDFFRQAVIAGLLASIACGVIGTFVVVKRISSIAGGISHAAFGGLGLGVLFGFSPIVGATGFCLLSALVIGVVYRREQHSLDTLISIVWSLGMALGLLFVSMSPGYLPDLNSYLFGNILLAPPGYLWWVAALDLLLIVAVVLCYRSFQAVCFDEEFAEVTGVAVDPIFFILLMLTALVVVVLIRVVGVIMMIALLTTPAAVARHWSDDLRGMILGASLISAACTSGGLVLSYWLSSAQELNAPTGPLIVLLAVGLFVLSACLRRFRLN